MRQLFRDAVANESVVLSVDGPEMLTDLRSVHQSVGFLLRHPDRIVALSRPFVNDPRRQTSRNVPLHVIAASRPFATLSDGRGSEAFLERTPAAAERDERQGETPMFARRLGWSAGAA